MSNEKQFENIENKLKKALESGEHAFNEEAWAKMEALLDKEEKKRRPIIWFWLLPVLLIGTLAIFKFTGNNTSSRTSNSKGATLNGKENPTIDKTNNKVVSENKQLNKGSNEKKGDEKVKIINRDIDNQTAKLSESDESINKLNNKRIDKKIQVTQQPQLTQSQLTKVQIKNNKKRGKKRIVVSGTDVASTEEKPARLHKKQNKEQKNKLIGNGSTAGDTTSSFAVEEPEKGLVDKANESVVSNPSQSEQPTIEQQKKGSGEKESGDKNKSKAIVSSKSSREFYIVGAAGVDAASVKMLSFANSVVVPKYGLSVGYKFSRKFSLQTGFFVSSKKYSAAGKDYHVKPGSYWSMYKITSVDAVCKVYDIPLSVRYDIASKPSLNFYLMAGVSSYIMKKEDYDYDYLNWGSPAEKSYGYTGNKHLFSNADISFGIEKKISNTFSLQLEPSVSVPIKGVGDGKVNLYSTSLMLGLKYLPFKK